MTLLRGLIDRLLLALFVIAAGAMPSFLTQYQQQVGGRLAQVEGDLAPFQAIADLRHDGSLGNLVDHHLASSDATFREEGDAIDAMVLQQQQLRAAYESLDADLVRQIWYLARNADRDVAHSTWTLFEPSFALDSQGMIFALLAGGVAWLAIMGGLGGLRALFRIRVRKRAR